MDDVGLIIEFLEESLDSLTEVSDQINALSESEDIAEDVNKIFRPVHSIKGAAAFFKLNDLMELSHKLESILDELRKFTRELTPSLVELLDEGFFALRSVVERGLDGDCKFQDSDRTLMEKLIACLENREIDSDGESIQSSKLQKILDSIESGKLTDVGLVLEQLKTLIAPEQNEQKPEVKATEEEAQVAKKEDSSTKSKPESEASKDKSSKADSKKDANRSIRIHVNLLEEIMNLVGELVLSRNQLKLHTDRLQDLEMQRTTQLVSTITSELQDKVMRTRLQPVSTVFNPIPTVVREIARNLNKKVEVVIEGKDTELDRSILEAIKDPMTHLIRNSLDHGIEEPEERLQVGKTEIATLNVKAFHEGSLVVIEISDDGRGVNTDIVGKKAVEKGLYKEEQIQRMSEREIAQIIFEAGFSTKEQASQISGRGVGMDVVKSNIQQIGGQVELDTFKGKGTVLSLKIPLTLAIIPALIVGAGDQKFSIPQAHLQEMVLLKEGAEWSFERLHNAEVFRLREKLLPLIRLDELVGIESNEVAKNIIVLNAGPVTFGLVVSRLYDIEEIVVKSLSDYFKQMTMFSGATIMGDGTVSMIFDIIAVAQSVGFQQQGQEDPQTSQIEVSQRIREQGQIVLFSLSSDKTFGIFLDQVERLERIERRRIESVSGKFFLQYRGRVLPIVSSWAYLGQEEELNDEMNLIVFKDKNKEAGLLIRSIDDIVNYEGDLREDLLTDPRFLGSCILSGKVVTILKQETLYRFASTSWERDPERERVILFENEASDGKVKQELNDRGFDVVEVNSKDELDVQLREKEIDIIVTDTSVTLEETNDLKNSINDHYGQENQIKILDLSQKTLSQQDFNDQLSSSELLDGLKDLKQSAPERDRGASNGS